MWWNVSAADWSNEIDDDDAAMPPPPDDDSDSIRAMAVVSFWSSGCSGGVRVSYLVVVMMGVTAAAWNRFDPFERAS